MIMETTTTPTALTPAPQQPEAAPGKRLHIPGDVVNKATQDLPDEQRAMIRWLHSFAHENNMSLSEVGNLIRYDASTVHRVFTGKYDGNLANVCNEIASARKLIEERASSRKVDFVETTLVRKIWGICTASLEYNRIGFVFGDSQIGKTTALEKYASDHNHGQTVMVRMPTGGNMAYFLAAMAKVLRLPAQLNEIAASRRIIESFDDRMLLIVDEAHQCLFTRSDRAARVIEFIREIHDVSHCGVVISATNVFKKEMESGKLSGIIQQVGRRRFGSLPLPNRPSDEDLAKFSAFYDLAPARGKALTLQTQIIADEALGFWLCLLRMAAKIAHKRKQKMTWDHVIDAVESHRAMEAI